MVSCKLTSELLEGEAQLNSIQKAGLYTGKHGHLEPPQAMFLQTLLGSQCTDSLQKNLPC